MSEFVGEIAEVESFLASATFSGVKTVLQAHLQKLKRAEADRLKREAAKEAEARNPTPALESAGLSVERKPVASSGKFVPIEDFAWDQGEYNSSTISIFVDLEGVGAVKDNVETEFTKSSFDLKVIGLDGNNYRLLRDNLEKDIVPDQCRCIVKKNKLVLKLMKVKGEYSFEHWSTLISKKKKGEQSAAAKKADPAGGLMDMMKDMYDDGDDNMRKVIGEAMMKSKMGGSPDVPGMPNL
mmetsp:Transcript_47847/g.97815  ORF Transcript_47847/g.97815 Transcript_47847/m.97815 type:complete len:239 (+) Transcript_47847:50-766(+)|eukprot:CAMPEP_0181290038 /NCGR_PEP_ID=MMETSP1101-20121128/1206_1 /TAXON_ID=46948 /ORGANISM="Rhodomonas abbreviata, Strain Caron Lab Isolate" /LENGTH=238 /DNA_ID=CAMNT_0023394307 /DNA_START=27 /DNA_END=743 /DNA_ORIENTATION=+